MAQYEWAALIAEQVLAERGLATLPVDPIELAYSVNIQVEPKPASAQGASGMLLRVGERFAIAYATHIDSDGFRRFSIGHELGHYFLSGHIDAVLGKNEIHESHAGFHSGDPYEIEADHFAAGLLMPRKAFLASVRGAGDGLTAIENLAERCGTSLTATAIRYAECAPDPIAIIVATGKYIDYCFMSKALRDFEGLDWLRKGEPLPSGTATYRLAVDPARVSRRERREGTCDIQDWLGGDRSIEASEDVVGLGSFGKTLTVLHGIMLPDDETEEDEDALEASWTPRFRR